MTEEGYMAALRAMGFQYLREAPPDAIMCRDRDGNFRRFPSPKGLSDYERESVMEVIRQREGIILN